MSRRKQIHVIFELRIYRIKKGHRDEWVKLMDTTVIPFQVRRGMVIVGSFVSVDDDCQYVWIRRFENETERRRLYDAVYGSDEWRTVIRPAMGDMLIREKADIRLLEATPLSPLQ